MRYMYIISAIEDGKAPPQRLFEEIDKLSREPDVAARMVAQGGLLPLAMGGGAQVRLKNGKLNVTDGPFTETKEVIGGFAIFEFATKEEALASAVRFMELHRLYGEGWEGVCEMRPMFDDAQGGCQPGAVTTAATAH